MDRQTTSSSNTHLAAVLVPITIGILAALAYLIIRYWPAQDFGELAWKLLAAAVVGIIIAFFGSQFFTSGSSGSLGVAVICLILELIVICLTLAVAGQWPESTAIVHGYVQWILMLIQALYLLFVALA